MRALVVVPTYDEADNLGELVGRVRASVPGLDLLVVDDDSPDGTGRLADGLAASDDAVHVLHRTGKDGLGAAYRDGFRWGLARGYEAFVQMDADLSHPPEHLPVLVSAVGHADVVVGSRYVTGGRTVGWPAVRRAISRLGNGYVSVMLNLGVRDATAGYRALRREVLEGADLDEVRSNGYCFQVEMTDRVRQAGFSVAEVPITFVERVAGASKMTSSIVFEALWRVAWWGLRDLVTGRRLQPRHAHVSYDLPMHDGTVDLVVTHEVGVVGVS